MHPVESATMPKMKNKVTGFNVRILDDGSYLLRVENSDYSKCKEYAYESFGTLMDELHKDFGKKKTKEVDYLTK